MFTCYVVYTAFATDRILYNHTMFRSVSVQPWLLFPHTLPHLFLLKLSILSRIHSEINSRYFSEPGQRSMHLEREMGLEEESHLFSLSSILLPDSSPEDMRCWQCKDRSPLPQEPMRQLGQQGLAFVLNGSYRMCL